MSEIRRARLLGDPAYRNLGIIDNPFIVERDEVDRSSTSTLISHRVAGLGLAVILEKMAGEGGASELVITRSPIPPAHFTVAAKSEFWSGVTNNPNFSILPVQLGLELMRGGKVRGVLGSVAEMVCGVSYALTLAPWVEEALREPDDSLAEWTMLAEAVDVPALLGSLSEDPEGFVIEHFGYPVWQRLDAETSETSELRASFREQTLAAEPDEDESSDEFDDGEPYADALVTRPEDPETTEDASVSALLVDYVVAVLSARISPVVGRSVRAYVAQGSYPAAMELRMTKAPKKTLKSLLTFATRRWDRVAVVYEHFEQWEHMPDDVRIGFISAFTEMKWIGRDMMIPIYLLDEGSAPELMEQLAAAKVVHWDFDELETVGEHDAPADVKVIERWLATASLVDGSTVATPETVQSIVDSTDGTNDAACLALGHAIEDAAERGVASVDDVAVAAGLAAWRDSGENE